MSTKNFIGGKDLLNPQYLLGDVLKMAFGSKVADLGCGSMGFNTLEAARLVGDQGQVYATDILKQVLSSVEGRAKQEGLYNVKSVWTNLEIIGATEIPSSSLDYCLLINTLFQSRKHKEILGEAFRLLKKDGKLLVVEWLTAGGPIGPKKGMRVDSTDIKRFAGEIGYKLESEFEAGRNHYGLIFKK